MACGELGLSIDYFYSLTPRQFANILIGYRRKEEIKEKGEWQRTRLSIFYCLLPHTDKKDFSLKDVFELPWDEEEPTHIERKVNTKKELQEYFNNLKKETFNG
ncbi:hypothetical protein BTO06_01100 [Tenacibaculum sp. SZ-18]|uniref:hypothetical protein n=1 Tax=Tenacibaculum sp. SZ-18 TaxID=754423 RepID=UPI000C2D6592|nr:hypothetical protein [Tenacibaculum sp. SZ-18]AUC13831.1 hypothetical protein BTO06_01100 [Tenacibaculum sp. SZ-18]